MATEISEDAQRLVTEAAGDIALAQCFSVVSNDGYIEAGEILKTIKGRYQDMEARRKEMTVPLDEAKKRIMDFFRQPLEQLGEAERLIKGAMVAFTQEQERIRLEEQQRIQALALEEQRQRDEVLEKQIAQAQEKGDSGKAEELLASATQAAVPVVQSEKPKVPGIKTTTRWRYKIIDEALIPREYLMPNEKLLADTAIATKGTIKVPGVGFYSESIVASTAR